MENCRKLSLRSPSECLSSQWWLQTEPTSSRTESRRKDRYLSYSGLESLSLRSNMSSMSPTISGFMATEVSGAVKKEPGSLSATSCFTIGWTKLSNWRTSSSSRRQSTESSTWVENFMRETIKWNCKISWTVGWQRQRDSDTGQPWMHCNAHMNTYNACYLLLSFCSSSYFHLTSLSRPSSDPSRPGKPPHWFWLDIKDRNNIVIDKRHNVQK